MSGQEAAVLFVGTLMLGALSCHGRSPTFLRRLGWRGRSWAGAQTTAHLGLQHMAAATVSHVSETTAMFSPAESS